MRILFFSSIFPRPESPIRGIYCLHACRAMIDLGHQVRVVSPQAWSERPRVTRATLPGSPAIDVEYPLYLYPPGVLQSAYHLFMGWASRGALRRVRDEARPDCVVSYWAHPDGAVAARFARELGIPAAVIVGGSDVLVLARRPGARRRSVLAALLANDAVITVGQDLAEAVIALGVPARKVHVVRQGVDTGLFSPGSSEAARRSLGVPAGARVLVAVGNLLPVKGIDVLLEAMARLRARMAGSDVRLYLVGDGASRGELEAQAGRLGLADSVRFVGKVKQDALPAWYRAADLTVLASRSEGVPNVLRESLACGTPFVATRVGGVHEIDAEAGATNHLVAPEDPGALATAIAAALTAPRPEIDPGRLLTWRDSTKKILDLLMVGSGPT